MRAQSLACAREDFELETGLGSAGHRPAGGGGKKRSLHGAPYVTAAAVHPTVPYKLEVQGVVWIARRGLGLFVLCFEG